MVEIVKPTPLKDGLVIRAHPPPTDLAQRPTKSVPRVFGEAIFIVVIGSRRLACPEFAYQCIEKSRETIGGVDEDFLLRVPVKVPVRANVRERAKRQLFEQFAISENLNMLPERLNVLLLALGADLSFTDDGLEVTIRRSKTDQEGAGRKVGIPYGGHPRTCPVRAVRDWLDLSLLDEGPLFRPDQSLRHRLAVTPDRAKRGLDRQAVGARSGTRPSAVRRAFTPSGPRYRGREGGQERALDYEADRASVSDRGPQIHPRCGALRRQRRGGDWPLTT